LIDKGDLNGIKGWLKTYLFYNIFIFLFVLWGISLQFYKYFIMKLIHSDSIYEITSYILLELLTILIIILICLKKVYTPIFVIGSESIGVVVGFIDFFLSRMRLDNYIELLISAGLGIVWILYFIRSRRVKNTFVR